MNSTVAKSIILVVSAILLFMQISTAAASVVIHQTRVIYPSDESEVVVRLSNNDAFPKLVQAWIDDGVRDASPGVIDTPFQIVTPLFRMDPNKGQVLRILQSPNDLPKDRESVFWLNVLEVPPKPQGLESEESYVQFSFRTRIKIFYRPAGLSANVEGAPKSLRWSVSNGQIRVENPTPYFISVSSVELVKSQGEPVDPVFKGMVSPFSSMEVPVDAQARVLAGDRIQFKAINDYGASPTFDARLAP